MQQTIYKYLLHVISMLVLSFGLVNNTYGQRIKTGALHVTASIVARCEVAVNDSLDFDDFSKFNKRAGLVTQYVDFSINCPGKEDNYNYDIEYDIGDNPKRDAEGNLERTISNGSEHIFYEIFDAETGVELGPSEIGGVPYDGQLDKSHKLRIDFYDSTGQIVNKKGFDDLIEVKFVFD